MILRRFTKHVTDQNWFAVGLDVLVVITGIFLGMQVTEWNEERKDVEKGRAYMMRIFNDLEATITAQHGWFDKFYKERKILLQAYLVLQSPITRENDEAEFLKGLFYIERGVGVDIIRSSMDELINGGDLALVPDAEVRIAIGNFLQSSERALYAIRRNREDNRPAIFGLQKRVNRGYGGTIPALGARVDLEMLKADPEAAAMLSSIMWNQHDMQFIYNLTHSDVITLKNKIAKALGLPLTPAHQHKVNIADEREIH